MIDFFKNFSLVDLGALIMRKVFQQNHRPALSIFLGMFFSLLISVNPMINRVYIKYKSDCGGDNNQTGAIGAG